MSIPQKMKICVVGGGTAGLVTALILQRRLEAQVDVLVPKNIPIIGVGEGSTEHWHDFISYIGKTEIDSVLQTKGTIKTGIHFKDWMTTGDYIHSVSGDFTTKMGLTSLPYAKMMAEGLSPKQLVPEELWSNKLGDWLGPDGKRQVMGGFVQYHFNTFELNNWLTRVCNEKQRDITLHDEEVEQVIVDDNGIKQLKCKTGKTYEADYYIDCTGFRRLLIGELGAEWQSYGKYLPLKEAIAFPTEDLDEYPLQTRAWALDAGWTWQIPTYGRTGNGYIYDTDFINKDQAVEEITKKYGKEPEVAKHIKFDPGKLDKVWIKNCIAVGLSANFLEPLEATSIGTSIQQSFMLMHRLTKKPSQREIDTYNNLVDEVMVNTRDFVALHYMSDRKDTPFWQKCSELPRPDTLLDYIDIWKERPLDEMDIEKYCNHYALFKDDNFNLIGYAHGFLKPEVMKSYWDNINKVNKIGFYDVLWERHLKWRAHQTDTIVGYIPHKRYIQELHRLNGDYLSIKYEDYIPGQVEIWAKRGFTLTYPRYDDNNI